MVIEETKELSEIIANFEGKWYYKNWVHYILIITLSLIPFGGILIIPLLFLKWRYYNRMINPVEKLYNAQKLVSNRIASIEEAAEKQITKINKDLSRLTQKLKNKEEEYDRLVKEASSKAISQNENLHKSILALKAEQESLNYEIQKKKKDLIILDDDLLYQDFALYRPLYTFTNIEWYKLQLDSIRAQQKSMIKSDTAVYGSTEWTLNNSKREGKKMVKDMKKLLLRAFNNECDMAISKVKYNNFDSMKKKITTAYTAVSKLGITMSISINSEYYDLKISELHLAFEYEQAKQREKEHQREIRAQERELAKLQKEIEVERAKIKKEKTHYASAISAAKEQLALSTDAKERAMLETKISELEQVAEEIDKSLKDIDYREANERAGYVYVISNIGSFGKDIYKIGMTRRLNPMDRINELGDASVPFNFDVHALIFSDNAPKLEAALHHAFEDKKLNLINSRREFFKVTLDEIEDVVRHNFDGTIEFLKTPEAIQYRESEKLRECRTS